MTNADWNKLILTNQGSILQSWEWGDVQQVYGRTVRRVLQDGEPVQAIQYPLPFKQSYWFVPYGSYSDQLTDGAMFVRFEPKTQPFVGKRVADVHPSHTLVTPLVEPDAMLESFKQKCRYNIRLAEKKGITVTTSDDVALFYRLLQNTAQTQKIRLHSLRYYQTIVDVLGKVNRAKIFFAYYKTVPIAAALVVYFGEVATYLHGGSDYQYRAVMAPYWLHWQIMQAAYVDGYKTYDWFGIAPANQPKHYLANVSRFKLGFGGNQEQRAGTYEQALRPMWYTNYRLVKKLWILS